MSDKTHHIKTSSELAALFASTTYVAIDFYADWCPPCKQIAPIYQKLAADNTIPGVLAFAKVNVDHVQDVAKQHSVTAMPTFKFFKEGNLVKVNGQPMIQGADPKALKEAIGKVAGIARERAAVQT